MNEDPSIRGASGSAAMVADGAEARTNLNIAWRGSAWSLTGLAFFNWFMTIITLGIYSFWGRTEVRKRIWSSVRLADEPLEYTGSGKELFLGMLVVFLLVLLPMFLAVVAITVYFGPESLVGTLAPAAIYLVFPFLFALASYRARRYRLTRTNWRGIRGTMTGSPMRYAAINYATVLLYPLTLGWIAPWRANMLQRRLVRETALGSTNLHYDGASRPLYRRFAVFWFAGIAALALAGFASYGLVAEYIPDFLEAARTERPPPPLPPPVVLRLVIVVASFYLVLIFLYTWYAAGMLNHFARSTTFHGARFSLSASTGGLVWLMFSNLLISFGTLGILSPVVGARGTRYFVERLGLDQPVDLAAILQNQAARGHAGEGLAQAFDIDAI